MHLAVEIYSKKLRSSRHRKERSHVHLKIMQSSQLVAEQKVRVLPEHYAGFRDGKNCCRIS